MRASASCVLRPLLASPATELHIAAAFPAAVYLADPTTAEVVMVVVTADGVAHPNAVVLAAAMADRPFVGGREHDIVRVAGNQVSAPWGTVTIGRWWSPRPTLRPVPPCSLRATLDDLERASVRAPVGSLSDDEAHRFAALTTAVATGRRDLSVAAVDRLLGLGAGLTPTGDDLLAGFVAAASLLAPATGPGARLPAAVTGALAAVSERIVVRADDATTAISAALLRHAVAGELCLPAARLLRELTAPIPSPRGLPAAVAGLLEVGATSGRDLLIGLVAGARLVVDATGDRTRRQPASHPTPRLSRLSRSA